MNTQQIHQNLIRLTDDELDLLLKVSAQAEAWAKILNDDFNHVFGSDTGLAYGHLRIVAYDAEKELRRRGQEKESGSGTPGAGDCSARSAPMC